MRKEYDFSKAKKNPYASQLKKQVTTRLEDNTVETLNLSFPQVKRVGNPSEIRRKIPDKPE
jgi:hypothetical protein